MSSYLLGMDLGTTNIKATIFDEEGVVISTASSSAYKLYFPGPNMVEQDPQEWWGAAVEILNQITTQAGADVVKNICGISISSHLPSLLPLDKDGRVLRNALIWMDKRGSEDLENIIETIGFSEYVNSAGAQPDAAFLPGKLLWYKKNEPKLFEKTHRILQANSYINYLLTGEITMDIDTASLCQCLDLRTLKWSESISKAIGADLNDILPQPLNNDEIIGCVTHDAAKQTGLREGTPVVTGTADCTASMYATGVSKVGDAGEASGTTSLLFVGHDQPTRTDISVVARPCAITGMPYVFNAPINTSGASINWYLKNLGSAEYEYAKANDTNVFEYLNELALQVPAGSNGLLYFPYLLGERAPLWNSFAKGMLIGLSLDTERKDIIRSVFEGTAFAVRHVMETIKQTGACVNSLRIAGGGAKSRAWCKIKASMLRVPVYTLDDNTGDVTLGNALIAGHAVGVYPDLSESIKKLIKIKEVIEPDEQWAEAYDELYPFYLNMYKHLEEDLISLKKAVKRIAN